MVVLTDEDLAELPVSSSREIAVEKFVPADQIDPMLLEKSYYLEPDKGAAKPYALLRDALKAADRMAVVTVSIRTRMTVAVLRVRDDVIVMQTMLWPDEVRKPEFAGLAEAEQRRQAGRADDGQRCWSSRWPVTTTRTSTRTTTSRRSRRSSAPSSRAARSPRWPAPRTRARARSWTCWPPCSAASSGPGPPAASRPTAGQPGGGRRRRPGGPAREGAGAEAGRPQDHRQDGRQGCGHEEEHAGAQEREEDRVQQPVATQEGGELTDARRTHPARAGRAGAPRLRRYGGRHLQPPGPVRGRGGAARRPGHAGGLGLGQAPVRRVRR